MTVLKSGRAHAFPATKGSFVPTVRDRDRLILLVKRNSLQLVRPRKDAWRLRRQRLGAVIAPVTLVTSFAINFLRAQNADPGTQLVTLTSIGAIGFLLALTEERTVWPLLARRYVDSVLEVRLKSAKYRRFSHTLSVASASAEFELTVYGPRRRVKDALSPFETTAGA
jgi:hypothetical protein